MKSPLKLLTATLATAALALMAPPPVEAQFTNPYTFSTWNNPISSSADTAIMNRAFQRMLGNDASGYSGSGRAEPQAPVVSAPLSASAFRPVGGHIMPQRLAADAALSPVEQRELTALYSSLLDFYHDWLTQEGEQRLQNNVAGAMMYLLLTSHYLLNDGEEVSQAEQDAILYDLNDALADDLTFQTLSPQAKQEIYETLVISAALPLALYFEGYETGDADLVFQAQQMIEATLVAVLTGEAGVFNGI
ncbi:hypothetical protein GFS31_42620 (plasmid) [Leptolyngbya sp. BL0902]|uniref:DUF6683 family protein n=1 Tax=Leptolyngbya sp. BL0902 TaxID=1115757 RepID=UPI0018E82AC5|nr:DUF6683 family protein [Leptolyngbya sp. BL0902]QQE67549.1 hypothetical protein GFS31_42620 [Leptolyngbya sp. BL0902]